MDGSGQTLYIPNPQGPAGVLAKLFPIIPVLKGIMGRFVKGGGRHALAPIAKVVLLLCQKNDTWTNRPGVAGSFR